MQYTVKYRRADGQFDYTVVEAASRAAVFPLLEKRGISPVTVTEGVHKNIRPSRSSSRQSKRPTPVRGILAGVCVVALAVGAWWWISSCEETPPPTEKPSKPKVVKPQPIKSAKPAPAPVATPKKPLTKAEKDAALLKEIRDKFGDNIPESLKATVYFLEHPPQKTFKVRSNADFLRHTSERQLAGVALVEPGTFFVMKPEFDESFDQDFLNALVDKIDINDDDSDETRAIKEGVTDLKREIAEICKRDGKKPSEVMNEHATAMYELGRYQRDLEAELDRIHMNPEYSDKDVEDFCEAANELLKSKGLAPIPHIDLARRSFRIKSHQRMAERKAERDRAKEESKEKAK